MPIEASCRKAIDYYYAAPFSWRVEKMKLTREKDAIIVNDSLTLASIPPEVYNYRLGNRSALEWIINQYRVTIDKRSGITSDPNREDDPRIHHSVDWSCGDG